MARPDTEIWGSPEHLRVVPAFSSTESYYEGQMRGMDVANSSLGLTIHRLLLVKGQGYPRV